jgi:exodeoxyribonuclease VII large subunit
MRLLENETQLQRIQEKSLEKMQVRLAQCTGKLNVLSPLSVLARGYATVRGENGQITKASGLTAGQDVSIRFADGEAEATVHAVHPIKEEN